jgi:hypothetical protein
MFVDVVRVLEFRLVQFSSSSFYMLYRVEIQLIFGGKRWNKRGMIRLLIANNRGEAMKMEYCPSGLARPRQ